MVLDLNDLYDRSVRSRTVWALREGVVVAGILLFWVAVALALTVVLFVVSVPFVLSPVRSPGLPVTGLVWTLVGPLAFTNAALYALARVGIVVVDHHRDGDGMALPASESTDATAGTGTSDSPGVDGVDETDETADEADETDGADGEEVSASADGEADEE